MKLVNLTPHDLIFYSPASIGLGGLVKVGARPVKIVPPSGTVCRVSSTDYDTGPIDFGIRVYDRQFSYISGLPEPEKGTLYIVSSIVAIYAAQHLNRADLVTPNDLVRNCKGAVLGCCSLSRIC